MDREITRHAQRVLEKQGISFQLSKRVRGAIAEGDGVRVSAEPVAGGEAEELSANVALLAGRAAVQGEPHSPLDVGLVTGYPVAEPFDFGNAGLDLSELLGAVRRVGGDQPGALLVEFRQ